METIELGTSLRALRAFLTEDFDEYKRQLDEVRRRGETKGYGLLLSCAFIEAVERRFGEQHTRSDIIEFVGEFRATYEHLGRQVDPEVGENLILTSIGDEDLKQDVDGETRAAAQTALLLGVVRDLELSADDVDSLLNDALRGAAEWAEGG